MILRVAMLQLPPPRSFAEALSSATDACREAKGRGADLARLLALDPLAAADAPRAVSLERHLAAGEVELISENGELAGYAVVTRAFFGRPFLDLLYLRKEVRGRGIGLAWLARWLARGGDERRFTSTNGSNAPMIRTLRRSGFSPCGLVDGLDPGDPELFFAHPPVAPGAA